MNHRFPRLLAGSLVVALMPLLLARADEPVPMTRLTPPEIDALVKPGPGAKMAPVLGDSTKEGIYSVRVTIPAHTKVPPHTHRDNRAVAVISGTLRVGYGTSYDEKALKELPPGSFYTEPAGQPHYTETRDEPVVIIVTGVGPSDTKLLGGPPRP
jgi:quercetin dioxygenase-like cupin family protein